MVLLVLLEEVKMENLNKKDYKEYAEKKVPKPTYLKNIIMAFLIGGLICTIGQIIINFGVSRGLEQEIASTTATISMIFIGALLTGLGVYDEISKVGGAGAAVPITGFANSMVSPAMEFKSEGFIFGVAAKMFILAGPVLVYGIGFSIIIGIINILISG